MAKEQMVKPHWLLVVLVMMFLVSCGSGGNSSKESDTSSSSSVDSGSSSGSDTSDNPVNSGDTESDPPPVDSDPDTDAPDESADLETPSDSSVAKNSIRQYTFNHSLWNHFSSIHDNVITAYWIGEFAIASGTTYAWNGQFGQLDYHALPPSAQLGSDNSEDLSSSSANRFQEWTLDNIVIMPPNFVQSTGSTAAQAEISDAQRVIDYIIDIEGGQQSGVPIYIYEHWPEAISGSLTGSQWSAYHAQTTGSYHQWFLDYQNKLAALYPNVDIRMVPVGPIIAEILQNAGLQTSQLSFTELYEDNSPHGRPNIYFLAGLIMYQAMYGQQVSDTYRPPVDAYAGVSQAIANDFTALNDFVWSRLNAYNENGVRIWP